MKADQHSLFDFLSGWKSIAPFLVAIIVLGFILLTAITLIGYPDDGIDSLSLAGQIISIQPAGPAVDKLQPHDTILSIDGRAWKGNFFSYADLGKKSGQPVEFEILRDGEVQLTQVMLASPSWSLILNRLVSILVALIFWLVGVGVEAFKPSGKGSGITSIWFQTSALTLTAGAASTMGAAWASSLFSALIWVLGPLSVHFHMDFPQPISWKGKPLFLLALYGIVLLGVAPVLFVGPSRLGTLSWYPILELA